MLAILRVSAYWKTRCWQHVFTCCDCTIVPARPSWRYFSRSTVCSYSLEHKGTHFWKTKPTWPINLLHPSLTASSLSLVCDCFSSVQFLNFSATSSHLLTTSSVNLFRAHIRSSALFRFGELFINVLFKEPNSLQENILSEEPFNLKDINIIK